MFGVQLTIRTIISFIFLSLHSEIPLVSSGIPLQWQQINPIGNSPAARYSHSAVTFDSPQGMIYLFGGFSGLSPLDCSSGCQFYDDTWMFDTPAQGWELINLSVSSKLCTTNEPNRPSVSPSARAEHVMASCGYSALMCGGYNQTDFMQDRNGLIDCWWLSPVPVPRWDRAEILSSGSAGPIPRSSHSLTFDSDNKVIILFGGESPGPPYLLSDCWIVDVSDALNGSIPLFYASYTWKLCSNNGKSSPGQRFGHGAAIFRGAFYILGGWVYDGLGGLTAQVCRLCFDIDSLLPSVTVTLAAQDDMWSLAGYADNGSWTQVSQPVRLFDSNSNRVLRVTLPPPTHTHTVQTPPPPLSDFLHVAVGQRNS